MSADNEIEAALEAILFASGDPVPKEKLLETFGDSKKQKVESALERLVVRYTPTDDVASFPGGVILDEVAGGLRFVTRPDLNSYLRKFFDVTGRSKLSMAALETLAVVAYRQPATGPEIQELRGKASQGVLKTLLEKGLIRISGRREVVGKPFEYSTTRDFLMHFGLSRIEDLPPLEDFEENFMGEGDFSGISQAPESEDREEAIEREEIEADEVQEVDEERAREVEELAEAAVSVQSEGDPE